MRLGQAVLRVVVGALFFGHGAQKLFGWFGGHGPDGTGQFFESLGLPPGKRNAYAAGTSEALGGTLLAAGAATPLAASMITGTMVTAIQTVHAPNGPWVSDNGYEYNLVLIALLFALTDVGPGALSIDGADGPSGLGWALAELALGVAGSYAVVAAGKAAGAQQAARTPPGVPPGTN